MSLFRHPHLTRGIVDTPAGRFFVRRGLIEIPDDTGERLGWNRADAADDGRIAIPQPIAVFEPAGIAGR